MPCCALVLSLLMRAAQPQPYSCAVLCASPLTDQQIVEDAIWCHVVSVAWIVIEGRRWSVPYAPLYAVATLLFGCDVTMPIFLYQLWSIGTHGMRWVELSCSALMIDSVWFGGCDVMRSHGSQRKAARSPSLPVTCRPCGSLFASLPSIFGSLTFGASLGK